jgi:beta-carotene hydroxylase
MKPEQHIRSERDLPSLAEVGEDILHISTAQRVVALALPFVCALLYALFALNGWWIPAVASLVYLSFITYGSVSHDLVHRNMGLPSAMNEFFLTAIELLAIRSGHAYRLAHLHHHARYPADDDIEGRAARMPLWRTLAEGVVFQARIGAWAIQRPGRFRKLIVLEAVACSLFIIASIAFAGITLIPLTYVTLMIMGSWIIPLITSYIPHTPDGCNAFFQTRMFRGRVASLVAMEHLYHLEHHLYPAVPHQNWPELARRLDPILLDAGVEPVKFWF